MNNNINKKMIESALGNRDSKLVEFLLFDDKIRGVDDIEWNNFTDEEHDWDLDDEWEVPDDILDAVENRKDECLSIYDWISVNDYFTDVFKNTVFPTYTFKGRTWVLKTFHSPAIKDVSGWLSRINLKKNVGSAGATGATGGCKNWMNLQKDMNDGLYPN